MKKALPAIVLFFSFIFCCQHATGQRSLPAASQKSLNSQLLEAADKGQLDKIVSLLKQGANIEAKDDNGMTPLIWAAAGGQSDKVRLLLEKGANIEATDKWGGTALINAVQLGHIKVMKLLLGKGANVEAKARDGETPLMQASNAEVAQLLLDGGADIDARDEISDTALIHAAQNNYTEVVKVLLDKGANIEARDEFGWRALQMATLLGSIDSVKLLLDRGADIEARDSEDKTALHLACAESKGIKEHVEIVNLLLNRGANIEAVDQLGQTPLILVAQGDRISTMKLLLDKGANIEARDKNGYTALLWAVEDGKTNAVKLLLERDANLEVKDNQGVTALDIANRLKSIAMADLIEQAARKRKQLEEAQAKDPRNIFAASLKAFQQSPRDESLREKVIQLSFGLTEPPPIPESARQLFVLATDQIKQAGTPAALDQPIRLLRKTLEISPWWGNAYYNLSRALEMSGQYDDAARQLNYYLKLKPAEADASEARAHLVVIQSEKDAAVHQSP